MKNTALNRPEANTAMYTGSGVPSRLPSLEELNHSRAEVDTSGNPAVLLSAAFMFGLVVCAFLVGHRDGFTAGKESVCIETGWHSPSCESEKYRREYLKDPPQ
jgi:hypothetical protein